MEERIQKILSQWGIASRRHAEKMILARRVHLNGDIVQLGQKANPYTDRLEVDGKIIRPLERPQLIYLLLNKRSGVVSTCNDPQNRPTVLDVLPAELREGQGIHPVGRLDTNSTGALLLTNDGDLTLRLTHPRYHLPKKYTVWVEGQPGEAVLENWRNGVSLSGKLTLPAQIHLLKQKKDCTLLEIVLREGRNRQIRRIAEQLGYPVLHLHRTAIGSVQLQAANKPPLAKGNYRFLETSEINSLLNQSRNTNLTPEFLKENHT